MKYKPLPAQEYEAEYLKIRHAYANIFNSPDGQIVLKDLEEEFSADTLVIVDGHLEVDASIAAAGCHKTILYIHSMKEKEDAVT
jgi:hypothetical protein